MSDGFDEIYREIILDHYKNPRGHGVIEDADAHAEGMNPLCGDEVAIYVAFDEDGETIEEVKFSGRGCAISQAATSMLMEMVKGRSADEVATMSKDELLEEVGIPLTPIRLKCALLGLGEEAVAARVLVVVEDHLAVQLVEAVAHPISSFARATPAASRSISSRTV